MKKDFPKLTMKTIRNRLEKITDISEKLVFLEHCLKMLRTTEEKPFEIDQSCEDELLAEIRYYERRFEHVKYVAAKKSSMSNEPEITNLPEVEAKSPSQNIDQDMPMFEALQNERIVLTKKLQQYKKKINFKKMLPDLDSKTVKEIIDRNRFKNGKPNYSRIGKEWGVNHETAKHWIKHFNLENY